MKRNGSIGVWRLTFLGFISLLGISLSLTSLADSASDSPKPSSYAPAADLINQVDDFIGRIEKDLSDEADYGEEQQSRVAKDSSTLAALALVLGLHDEKHELREAAPKLLEASQNLADHAEDFSEASAALAEVKKSLKSKSDSNDLKWEEVASLEELMKQVPIVNNSLRRGVNSRRFKRSQKKNAGYAATLAAIAQVSIFDTAYCEDEEAEKEWAKICAEMRDASAGVSAAIRKGDQTLAKKSLEKLVESCDDCHEKFRD